MVTYQYTALEASGKKKVGILEAANQEAAIAQLVATGSFVLEIGEKHSEIKHKEEHKKRGKVSRAELAMFTRRLSDLSSAGLPLDRALSVAGEQAESISMQQMAEEALEEVRGGLPVSEALAKHPKLFNTVYTQTLRAGEASGQFPEVAGRLADFEEKEVARRSQIVSAMVYPAVLLFAALGVITFMLTFVVPKLATVFEGLGSDLPLSTKILLATSTFLATQWLYIIGGVVGAVLFYRAWASTDAGALTRDRMILRLPVAGKIISKAVISRYARVLGTLVYGGVPIMEALNLAGQATGNRVMMSDSKLVEEEVREGVRIADAMRDTESFPSLLTHMVAIGEETGDLPRMLNRVADSMDFEVDHGMTRLTSIIEPAIVLFMGGFVGFVVLSILLPIYAAQNLVK